MDVTVRDATVRGDASADGGGLFHFGGRLEIEGTVFTDNLALGGTSWASGGAITSLWGTALLIRETLVPRQQLGSVPFAIVNEPGNELQDLELRPRHGSSVVAIINDGGDLRLGVASCGSPSSAA